jgi:hypothetical protein
MLSPVAGLTEFIWNHLIMTPLWTAPLLAGPVLPFGWDTYRIENWPVMRPLMRTMMPSTYDRSGGNEGADASHFLYGEGENFHVVADVRGSGWLAFSRFNRWHGSPWHFEVDGQDNLLTESNLLPPLGIKWNESKGADLMWRPFSFTSSLRIAYSKTHYGTGYFIIQRVFPGAATSVTMPSRDIPRAVTSVFDRAGFDQSPRTCITRKAKGSISVSGPATVRHLELRIPRSAASHMRNSRISIDVDGRQTVRAPVPLFFGAGALVNRNGRRFLVRSIPVSIEYLDKVIVLRCNFPMPFQRSFKVTAPGDLAVRYERRLGNPAGVGYFHAEYRDHGTAKTDAVLFDAEGVSGHIVGTSIVFTHRANLPTLEGDPRIYLDGSRTPQCHGTGTEEWGGGGDYWSGEQSTLPLCGHPVGAPPRAKLVSPEDGIHSLYRFLLPDVIPFMRSCKMVLERGAPEHYESVVYWYGRHIPYMRTTDTMRPAAKYTFESSYEYDKARFRVAAGRTRSSSAYTIRIDPRNIGVLLSRTFDYEIPNQAARAYVDGIYAGTWYSAGSTLGYYSNPPGENDVSRRIVQRSPYRLRQDEFLLPVRLTRGKNKVRLVLEFVDKPRRLFPNGPAFSPSAWSEISFRVECILPSETLRLTPRTKAASP